MIDLGTTVAEREMVTKEQPRAAIESVQFGVYGAWQGFELHIAEDAEAEVVASDKMVEEVKSFFDRSDELRRLHANRTEGALDLVERFPGSHRAWLNLAASWINGGEIQEARKAVQKALDLAPDSSSARAMLGRVLILEGNVAEAAATYRDILSRGSNVAARETLAMLDLASGSVDQAIEELRAALDEDPGGRASLHYNLGLAHLLKRKSGRAISCFRKALRQDPSYYMAYGGMAIAYAMQGQMSKAERMFRVAVETEPTDLGMKLNLGQVLASQERWDDAIAVFERLTEDCPTYWEAREALAHSYFVAGRYREAAAHYARVLQAVRSGSSGGSLSNALNNLGVAQAASGSVEEGIDLLRESINVSGGQNAKPRLNLARVYLRTNRLRKAQGLIGELRERLGEDKDVLNLSAWYNYLSQDYDRAAEDARQVLRKDSTDLYAACLLSTILTEVQEDYAGAEALLRQVEGKHGKSVKFLNNLAYALAWQGRFAEARTILERIPPGQDEDHAVSTATWGFLRLRQGDVVEGGRFYNEAAKLASDENLRRLILQKKELELGRFYLEAGEGSRAKKHLERAVAADVTQKVFTETATKLLGRCG